MTIEPSSTPGERHSTGAVILACLVSLAACGFALSTGSSDLPGLINPETLQTAELLQADLSEEVCVELLKRDISPRQLTSTVQYLARTRRTTVLNVLCSLTENLKDAPSVQVRNLTRLFAEQPTSRRIRIRLLSQPRFRNSRSSRQVVAGVTAALQEDAALLLQAARSEAEQIEILSSLAFVPSEPVRRVLYDQVRHILATQTLGRPVQQTAIQTLSESGLGHEIPPSERAADLIQLTNTTDWDSAKAAGFEALAAIAVDQWPTKQVGVVASEYIAWRARNPGSDGIGKLEAALISVLAGEKRKRFEQRIRELELRSKQNGGVGSD